MSVKALRKIQMGLEAASAHGTAVAATAIWRGEGLIDDQTEVTFVPEDVGYLSGTDRTYIARVGGIINMTDTPATFEQLPYILAAGIQDIVAGTADGAGSGKIYQYDMPTTAAKTIQSYTIEAGDDQQAEEMEYSFVEDFTLAGSAGEALMMSATWRGRQVSLATFTGPLSLVTVEEILFSKGKMYIDAASVAFGTTQASNTFLGMNLTVDTGWEAVETADGALYFTFAKSTMPEVLLNVTFEHDAVAVAEKAAWRAETPRNIRLIWTGSALATTATYDVKTLQIDLAGKWESFDMISEQDGNDIVTGTFRSRYNADATQFAQFTIINEVATLP